MLLAGSLQHFPSAPEHHMQLPRQTYRAQSDTHLGNELERAEATGQRQLGIGPPFDRLARYWRQPRHAIEQAAMAPHLHAVDFRARHPVVLGCQHVMIDPCQASTRWRPDTEVA